MKIPVALWLALLGSALGQFELIAGPVRPEVPNPPMMETWLKKQAFAALDLREAEFELLDADSIRTWQTQRKAAFVQAIGGFPDRTPLNPKITGKRSFEDYRIEKLYFESQPGLHVTATLYLPLGKGPFPGVIHPTGHSPSAKARDIYQEANIVIVKGGCAVLCYDPIGQGERRQLFKPDGKSFATTQEHTLINQGSILLGSNTARTMIWDGMRAIDYLQSRPDIVPEKSVAPGFPAAGRTPVTSWRWTIESSPPRRVAT